MKLIRITGIIASLMCLMLCSTLVAAQESAPSTETGVAACYSRRLSLVWKADLEGEANPELLSLDRVMSIFITDLRKRKVDFRVPADPLSDKTWIATLDSIYGTVPGFEPARERNEN